MYDVIIVGCGPAGLSASIYCRRNNKKTLILESNSYGGQIVETLDIENYPVEEHISGFDFATRLYNQSKNLGTEIKFEKVNSVKNYDNYKEVITAKDTYKTKTIILATGSRNRKLGLEKEDKYIGKGVSYCATCDGAFYKNKVVCVVGSGNTAVGDALYLSELASKVYIIIRKDKFSAEESNVEELKSKNNIEIVTNSNVVSLNGKDILESIDIKDNNGIRNIKTSGLFVAIGRVPNNEEFKDLINLDDYGYIIAKEDCHTNVKGIFVSGDNRTKDLRQLVTATSDGAIAATEAIKYISKNNK